MQSENLGVFLQDFLTSLLPALEAPTSRELVQQVHAVCERFQERGRGDVRVAVIPLAFWTQFTADFVETYIEAKNDVDLLPRLRVNLRSQMRSFAHSYSIHLEDLNA